MAKNLLGKKKLEYFQSRKVLAQNFPGDKRKFYEEFFGSLYNRTEISTRRDVLFQYWMMPTAVDTMSPAVLTHATSHTKVAPRALTNARGRTAVLFFLFSVRARSVGNA